MILMLLIGLCSFISSSWAGEGKLPSDPRAAGKASLAGIDSDHDGVRDDVQRWIAMTYPNLQKTRAALTQSTKTVQEILLNAAAPVKSLSNVKQMIIDTDCLEFVSPDTYYEKAVELKAIFLNNYVRSKAWLQANTHLSGNIFTSLSDNNLKQGCKFNPDTMLLIMFFSFTSSVWAEKVDQFAT